MYDQFSMILCIRKVSWENLTWSQFGVRHENLTLIQFGVQQEKDWNLAWT